MTNLSAMSAVAVVTHKTDSFDLLRLAFRTTQMDGSEPYVRNFVINQLVAPMDLLPDDAQVTRCVTSDTITAVLATCSLGTIFISAYPTDTTVTVSAATVGLASSLAESIQRRAPDNPTVGTVPIRTWYLGPNQSTRANDRRIATPSWSDIARNYPESVRRDLTTLVSLERPVRSGKLILWHGEPGTGKTTALRALFSAWEPWCSVQYIADPERFFSSPGYISEVLSRATAARYGPTLTNAAEPESRWRLIVAEDTDEYLRVSARRDAGAGLGRLLNLADGVLGQGFNTLILLTTNEELHRVHPAVTRPGRCLSRTEFTRFPQREARAWLPNGCPVEGPMTLAEMYERRGEIAMIGSVPVDMPVSNGYYL